MNITTEIIIKKAKIIDDLYMEIEYSEIQKEEEQIYTHEYKVLRRNLVHQDLKDAYNKLKVHLAFLSEFVNEKPFKDDLFETGEIFRHLEFEKFKVTSFTIGGDGEYEGVTVTGRRTLKGNKILNINTPFTMFADQEHSENYIFQYQLFSDVSQCIEEVIAYIGGKHAPNPQLEIELK